MAKKNCKALGGSVYTGAGSKVVAEAKEKKRGGALAFDGESTKKPKKAGGGATSSPFSSAGGGKASTSPFSSARRG